MAHYKPLYRNNTDDTTQHQHNFKREKLDTWTHQTLTKVPCHNFRNFLSIPAWYQGIRLCLFNLSSQMTSSFSPFRPFTAVVCRARQPCKLNIAQKHFTQLFSSDPSSVYSLHLVFCGGRLHSASQCIHRALQVKLQPGKYPGRSWEQALCQSHGRLFDLIFSGRRKR